jgi:hypothetical protein
MRQERKSSATRNRMKRIFVVLGLVLALHSGARAQVPADLSCLKFSTNPDDRSGPPIEFSAELWDGPQRAPTQSAGTGQARFTLERSSLRLTWAITFKGLSGAPVELQAHGPTPAEGLAPAMFSLAPKGFGQPVRGERVLSVGEATFFLQNAVYVNLTTARYPLGEIRGTAKRLRPKC